MFINFGFPRTRILLAANFFRLISWSLCCFLVPLIGRCITGKTPLSQNTACTTIDSKNALERLLAPRASGLNQRLFVCQFISSPGSNLCFLAMTSSAHINRIHDSFRLKDFNRSAGGSPVSNNRAARTDPPTVVRASHLRHSPLSAFSRCSLEDHHIESRKRTHHKPCSRTKDTMWSFHFPLRCGRAAVAKGSCHESNVDCVERHHRRQAKLTVHCSQEECTKNSCTKPTFSNNRTTIKVKKTRNTTSKERFFVYWQGGVKDSRTQKAAAATPIRRDGTASWNVLLLHPHHVGTGDFGRVGIVPPR